MLIKSFQKTPQGDYVFNKLAFDVKPYWLTPNNANLNPTQPEQITMLASSPSAQVPLLSVEEGAVELAIMTAEKTGACLVNIFDSNARRPLTGRPCHVDTIFGTGAEPFILAESQFLLKRQALLLSAVDISGSGNAIRPVFGGQRINPERSGSKALRDEIADRRARKLFIMPFMCPMDQDVVLTANQEREYYYTQEGGANFEIKKLTYSSTGAFKFKVKDETGQELTENWVHSTTVLGSAGNPYMLYGSWTVKAGGKVTFTFKDLSGTGNSIYLTLCGRVFFV